MRHAGPAGGEAFCCGTDVRTGRAGHTLSVQAALNRMASEGELVREARRGGWTATVACERSDARDTHASGAPLGRKLSQRRAKGGHSLLAILRQRAVVRRRQPQTSGAALSTPA